MIDRLDAAATARDISRNAYVVEVFKQHARQAQPTATRESAEFGSDLGNEEFMRAA